MSSPTLAIEHAAQSIGYRSPERYVARARFLFDSIDLRGKRVLDVGCGKGAWAIWAAIHGASHVLGLEPEADGARSGTLASFKRLINDLSFEDRVIASSDHLEDTAGVSPFDVAVLFDVINHIDEKAVVALHHDQNAVAKFVATLRQMKALLGRGATVIVADCGRKNLWNTFGLRSPLAPTIEWEKHQEPEIWISIFRQAGFQLLDLRWSPLYPFGRLTSNRLAQFATASHFVLRFRVPIA
jgi:cyclopropane fatty-acyl-phospholipid synthase-like methyltransferase